MRLVQLKNMMKMHILCMSDQSWPPITIGILVIEIECRYLITIYRSFMIQICLNLKTILTYITNCLKHFNDGRESKYRRINCKNTLFIDRISKSIGYIALLSKIGWKKEIESFIWVKNDPVLLYIAKEVLNKYVNTNTNTNTNNSK